MAQHEYGNTPINSTGAVPVAAPSTATLFAELDSTRLGTNSFAPGQSRIFEVTYIVGAPAAAVWLVGSCTGTALNSGVDEVYLFTSAGLSQPFTLQQVLEKDYRLRVRQFSTTASGMGYISAVPLT